MSLIDIVTTAQPKSFYSQKAEESFGDMVKAVVDCQRKCIAIGGEMHADAEQVLLEDGSEQQNLWGINLYPDESLEDWLEFDSMINIRPWQNNRSRSVEDEAVQKQIREIVSSLVAS